MKFTVTALLAALATTCFAQNITIVAPANNSYTYPGDGQIEIGYDDSFIVSLYTAVFFYHCTENDFIGR